MAKVNTTRYIILGLLSHESLSGYDMKKRIETSVSHFWNVGYSQIYPALAELLSDGMIFMSGIVSSGGPQKHVYTITEAGRQSLHEWLLLPAEKEYTRYEILLKLFFGARLPIESTLQRIDAFRSRYQQKLGIMSLFKSELGGLLHDNPDHLNYYITVLFGEYIYDAYIRWADEAAMLLKGSEAGDRKE